MPMSLSNAYCVNIVQELWQRDAEDLDVFLSLDLGPQGVFGLFTFPLPVSFLTYWNLWSVLLLQNHY